ncbi:MULTISPECIES: HK97 family phage prohead protease [Bacillaceae]|uniref:HK97 family phage prohead protease n=1 Tax=Evansella alkalicola TaxID=745819 RepID=A0ABS6JZW1_9BACI|nr:MULTISPECIES: HK97 family phage prohead protease [Bacillaceae]MBU9724131.1 HK97 family phage prohead protease [Bacillus alkalicola]
MNSNPMEKIQGLIDKGRDFRHFANFEIRSLEESKELYVEGYAVTFNEPTVLFEYDGVQYKEQIDDRAFDEADLSDVIFNYNHAGKVMARTRNKTLQLHTDSKGLYIKARLDGTEEGRKLYEEIQGGYIDRMSFQFSVNESAYDSDNHLRTVRKVKKLYDVSAVDIPAYDTTSIYARSLLDLDRAEKEKLDSLNEQRKRKIILLNQIIGGIK